MFVGLVVVPGVGDDAGLGLQDDLFPLGRAQLERVGEPAFAQVGSAAGVEVHPGSWRHQL